MLRQVRSDEDGKLVWGMLLNDVELVQVNVGQNFKLVLLETQALELKLRGKAVDGLGHWWSGYGIGFII